ncbi:MAG TPA: hypothetical protein VKP66_04815 [Steroidobacteraceae bacterium]|nr:hypothetical protein [Steroidobacteraceae bacterium]
MRVLTHNDAVRYGVCVSLAVMGAQTCAAATPAAATPVTGIPMAAVWREQHVEFVYKGRTSRYSCEGLRDKVRAILLDLGARRDLKIAATGCENTGRMRNDPPAPSLSITFSAPSLPDPSVKPLHQGDLSATDARFEPFIIAGDAFRNLGLGDCELVQEFSRQILPKLATRALKRDIACVPYQASVSRFLVRGEILRPLPRAEQAVGRLGIRDR